MAQCNRCHKHKRTNISKPTAVSEHFLSNDHNANDMQLMDVPFSEGAFFSKLKFRVFCYS